MAFIVGSALTAADIDTPLFNRAEPTQHLWVSSSAASGGNGSKEHPFSTIQAAVTAASAGTAIMVKAGTYVENVKLPTHNPGTPTAPVWLVSADGPQAAKIHAATDSVSAIYGYGTDNYIVKGFEIRGGLNGIQFSQSGSNFSNLVGNIVIQGNKIYDTINDGIKISQADRVYVMDNVTIRTGQEGIDFVATNDSVIARNNVSFASGAAGIFAKGGSTNVLISNNVVHDIAKDGIEIGGWTGDQFFRPGYKAYEASKISVVDNHVMSVGQRPLNILGAINSEAHGNWFEANPKYPTAIQIGIGYPSSAKIKYSSNINITDNIISNAKRVVMIDNGNNNNISLQSNHTEGQFHKEVGPQSFQTIAKPIDYLLHEGTTGAEEFLGTRANDIFIVNHAGDTIKERPAAGIDTVQTTRPIYVLSQNLENLTSIGKEDFKGIGNSRDNVIVGGPGNDTLDGKGGSDTMSGGVGDDTYVVNSAGDIVVEHANSGTDLIRSSISIRLNDYVENLTLFNSGAINGTGNVATNVIKGNGAPNVLNGGGAADVLTGGKGDDTFLFHKGEAEGDVVTDFKGAGALGGDRLEFAGYGDGTFTRIGSTDHYLITPDEAHGGVGAAEIIQLANVFRSDLTQGGGHGDYFFLV
jgi:serralysin